MSIIWKTESAYTYPLLIKHLLYAPLVYNPHQEIVYRGTVRLTYAGFRERVGRLASALLRLGVREGTTVGVLDWDSHRYLECFFAIPMIGAVLHTVNVRLSSEQLVYTIDHAEDEVLIVHEDFLPMLEQIRGRIDTVKKFILIREASSGGQRVGSSPDKPGSQLSGGSSTPYAAQTPSTPLPASFPFAGEYEDLLSHSEPLREFPDFDENTRATIFYTTGTTGLPKGVYFSHRQIVLHTLSGLIALGSVAEKGRFHTADVYMPLTPMFHVHAWGIPYMATVLGVKQVYPGKYVPSILLSLLRSEGVTFSHCVPTILHMLLKDPGAKDLDLSRWKVIIGGAALPKGLAREALKRGIDIFSGYGLSETCPVLSIARIFQAGPGEVSRVRTVPREGSSRVNPIPEGGEAEAAGAFLKDEEAAPGPVSGDAALESSIEIRTRTGNPIPLVYTRVVNEQEKDVPPDDRSTGEILARAPWLTQGYWKDHTNSEKLWEGGWLHTGDIGCVDVSGSLRITDRKKDIIKVGGEWISSLALEDILSSHPAVAEAAVIGQPDTTWGEIPLALVVLKRGPTGLTHGESSENNPPALLGAAEKGPVGHGGPAESKPAGPGDREAGPTERELIAYVKTYVDSGILPREAILLKVRFVPSLDKTSVGKVNKVALRGKYGG